MSKSLHSEYNVSKTCTYNVDFCSSFSPFFQVELSFNLVFNFSNLIFYVHKSPQQFKQAHGCLDYNSIVPRDIYACSIQYIHKKWLFYLCYPLLKWEKPTTYNNNAKYKGKPQDLIQ